jgi:hypothetical protein
VPAKREICCQKCGTTNRVPRYSIRQIPRCGRCSELPDGTGRRLLRYLYPNRRPLLFLVALIAFLPVEIGTFTFRDRLTSRSASLARNPPDCGIPLPRHGVYWQYFSTPQLGTLTVKTNPGENYFVKLVDVRDGITKTELFIHGGQTFTANVPLGVFTIKYADGLFWCGEEKLFGPDTAFQETDKTFNFGRDNSWTIELIAQKFGNLRTKTFREARS